ncbi:MAG: hypothetical protein EHM17_13205 [Verrucomicrobiaceae bacterium]|nr:MAG: hypothetical protein EHM17_13205 [Verrucomicrobiaceae bacterium]
MKAPLAIALLSLPAIPWATAQNTVQPPPPADSFLESAGDFHLDKPGKPNEVTVVLPPPTSDEFLHEATDAEPAKSKPVAPAAGEAENPAPPAAGEIPETAPQPPQPGLAVRVERLQAGNGEIDPAQVKLLAPFPAKLLARSPEGWRIEASESAPPFTREVEISPGKHITLTVRPHLLVAEADGQSIFQVPEPGFDAPLGYRQDATVGAILATSIRQLDDDSKQLGNAIDQLQQLLISLPQPTQQAPAPEPEAKSAPARKR